jgi:hypothetical protein
MRFRATVDARVIEGVGAGVSTLRTAATRYLSRGGAEYHVTTRQGKQRG